VVWHSAITTPFGRARRGEAGRLDTAVGSLRTAEEKQKKMAGKRSGLIRACRAEVRRRLVKAAFDRLDSLQQFFPYSEQSIDALQKECHKILAEARNQPALSILMPPFKVSHATLIKDLQLLGVHPGRRIQRSG